MGTLNEIRSILNEASKPAELSGYIDMQDPQTIDTPENPAIIIVGIGKLDYQSLKKDVERKCKDLERLAKRGEWKFMYKQIGKIQDHSGGVHESPLQSYIRALIQVEEKMASGPYKRKITLAKRKR